MSSPSPPSKKQKTGSEVPDNLQDIADEEANSESKDLQKLVAKEEAQEESQIPSKSCLKIADEESQESEIAVLEMPSTLCAQPIMEQDPDQVLQQINDEDLICHEEATQKAIHDDAQVEVEGDHQRNIQLYIRNQLPAIYVTSVDANLRATIVDGMLTLVFDRYFSTYSLVQAENALNPHTVASCALFITVKIFHDVEIDPLKPSLGTQFEIWNRIQYRLSTPTTKKLLDAIISLTGPHELLFKHLCSYLTELALLDRDCSGFQITVIAAGCLFLGQFVSDPNKAPLIRAPWECDAQRLKDVVTILHELFLGTRLRQCRIVRTKYSSDEFGEVSTLECPTVIPDNYF